MIKPRMLKRGDRVALVSLSSGMGGEALFRHRYELGKQRLESEFGLTGVPMPHALKGSEYLDRNPKARAADLMRAFADPAIKGVFSIIGGEDTIRLLPHVDFDVIRKNPKVFMGYSDTTVNHFMLHRAGLVSFYGPAVLSDFAENGAMHGYTKNSVREVLFEANPILPIDPSPVWTAEFLDWADADNDRIPRRLSSDEKGYQLLQGEGAVRGKLLGGCIDVFPMLAGTELWPSLDQWRDAILFLETSEECVSPTLFSILLRGLAAQGVLGCIRGILFGKPMGEKYAAEYHAALQKIVGRELGRPELPILANLNFGHNAPMCILPLGVETEIDCGRKTVRLMESAVEE